MKKQLLLLFLLGISLLVSAQAPTITSFTPLNANPSDAVTIIGADFNSTAGNNIVFFGATQAAVTSASTTSLTVTVPIGATYAPITVLNIGTGLVTYSLKNFTPTYSPAKVAIGTSSFAAKQDFSTHAQAYSVTIGDLDGDGKPDLAVASYYSNSVSVYRNISISGNIGSGSFDTKQDFTTASGPSSVAISDLDGDGKPDLAIANNISDNVSVLRNTSTSGSIDFAAKVDFTTGSDPFSLAIGDLDGDGKPDLAVANFGTDNVSVLHNTSTTGSIENDSFETKVDFGVGSGPYFVAIGDLDGDGKLDLAVATQYSDCVSVLHNTSIIGSIESDSFATEVRFPTGNLPTCVAIGDLDGDGKPDLAVAHTGFYKVSVLRNTSTSGSIGTNSFAAKVDFTTVASSFSVAIGDLDGDGKADLAVANFGADKLSVLRNTSTNGSIGSGSFAAKVDFTTGIAPFSVAIGDLDGDGKSDLAVVNYNSSNLSILRNTSNNTDLSALTLNNGVLSPAFASGTIAYTASVTNAISSITATPTQADAKANIQVQVNSGGYVAVTSGSASGALALNVGSNTIDVKVSAEDTNVIKTYTVTVTRAKADQTITFPNFSAKTTTSPDFEPGATTDSGLALTYTSSNTSVATVYQDGADGNKWKVHILTDGTTDIEAIQAGNATYNSASFIKQLEIGGTLPVELINYQAKIQNNKEVLLSWVTSSELNNAGFEIWKATDGKSFEKLTFVKGAGNSATKQRYNYVDLSPNKGDNYYKLIQLDKDGVGKEVGLKSVRFDISKQDIVSVYPNPTRNFVNIDFEANKFTSISISDVSGKVILRRKISSTESKLSLNVEKLPKASYIIKLQGANGSVAKTFIKL